MRTGVEARGGIMPRIEGKEIRKLDRYAIFFGALVDAPQLVLESSTLPHLVEEPLQSLVVFVAELQKDRKPFALGQGPNLIIVSDLAKHAIEALAVD